MDHYFLARYGVHAMEERSLMITEMAYFRPTDQIHSCFPVFKPSSQRVVQSHAGLVGTLVDASSTGVNMISHRLRKHDSGFDELHQVAFY
jgi:hypothetical protein